MLFRSLIYLILFIVFSKSLGLGGEFLEFWKFLFLLPLPLASIAFYIFSGKKGLNFIKNLVVGIIFTVIILFLSLSSLLTSGSFSKDYSFVNRTEQIINFDIPDNGKIVTNKLVTGADNKIYHTESKVKFTDTAEIEDFKINIQNSDLWSKKISPANNNLIPSRFNYNSETDSPNYYMIYNITLDSYNQPLTEYGEYEIIFLAFNSSNNILTIIEYTFKIE